MTNGFYYLVKELLNGGLQRYKEKGNGMEYSTKISRLIWYYIDEIKVYNSALGLWYGIRQSGVITS